MAAFLAFFTSLGILFQSSTILLEKKFLLASSLSSSSFLSFFIFFLYTTLFVQDGNFGNATILADPMEDSLKCRPFTCLIKKNILLSAGGSIASATVQLELVEDAALTPTEIQLFHSRNRSIIFPGGYKEMSSTLADQ
jgi:hypothetical protein